MTNFGKWLSRLLLAGLATASMSGCVQQDDKKEESPAPPPAAPPAEPARSAVAIDAKVTYAVATAAGKCLQFGGSSKADADQAEMDPCNGSPAQQFKLQALPGKYYSLVNVISDKCLDVAAFAMSDAAKVQQYTCNGGANQNWIVADGSAGMVRLVARHSGKALTVTGAGNAVGQQTWTSAPTQQFKLKGPAAPEPQATGTGGAPGSTPDKKAKKKANKHADAKAAPSATP